MTKEKPEQLPMAKFPIKAILPQVMRLLVDYEVGMTEKIDGRRYRLQKTLGSTMSRNKLGDLVSTPLLLEEFSDHLPGSSWVINGEYVPLAKGRKAAFYVFDVPYTPIEALNKLHYGKRMAAMALLLDQIPELAGRVKALPVWTEPKEKLGTLLYLRDSGAEGVVFKQLGGAGHSFKYKFYKSVDVIVTKKRVDGKATCEIAVMNDVGDLSSSENQFRLLGNVGVSHDIITKMANVNQVAEIRYRTVSEKGKLIEPVFVRLRNDKLAYNCTSDQLQESLWATDFLTEESFRNVGIDYRAAFETISDEPISDAHV